MLIESESGVRCQGLYRGQVVQHLTHGRLKVFVYGVYPKEYINLPDLLPICEQMAPLWGGTYNGNGGFSYPNLSSTIWIQFANEDVNYPLAVGTTLGGENAYWQYENIKAKDEEISEKHMFTTGMAHFQMHESGKISSYVQLPFDNNVSIDFSQGDASCEVSADIAKQIDNNEISHVVCQQVLDNTLNNGEISSSVHHYEPYKYSNSLYLSDTQEVILNSEDRSISSINYGIKNNLGNIIDNEICAVKNNKLYVYLNLQTQIAKISSLAEDTEIVNNETTNISGKKDINLNRNKNISSSITDIDIKTNALNLNTHNNKTNTLNIEQNYIDDKKNIQLIKDDDAKETSIYYNDVQKILSSLIIDEQKNYNQLNILNISGEHTVNLNNTWSYNNSYLVADSNANEITLSTKSGSIDNLSTNQIINDSKIEKKLATSSNNKEKCIKIDNTGETILSTLDANISTQNNTLETLDKIDNTIVCEKTILSNYIDKQDTIVYTEHSKDLSKNYIDVNANLVLGTEKNLNIISSTLTENVVLNDKIINSYTTNSSESVIKLLSSYEYIKSDGTNFKNNITVDNQFNLNMDGSSTLCNNYNLTIDTNGTVLLSSKKFVLNGSSNGTALFELNNYEKINNTDIIDSNSKILLLTNKDSTSILLKSINQKDDISCYTEMEANSSSQKYETTLKSTGYEFKITMNPLDELLEIFANGTGTCKIKFDTYDGSIYITSDKNINLKSTDITLKASNVTIDSDTAKINFKDNMSINSKGGGPLIINSEVNVKGNIQAVGEIASGVIKLTEHVHIAPANGGRTSSSIV